MLKCASAASPRKSTNREILLARQHVFGRQAGSNGRNWVRLRRGEFRNLYLISSAAFFMAAWVREIKREFLI